MPFNRKEYSKKWRLKNPAYMKEWHLKNPEWKKEYGKEYRLKNKEYFIAYRLKNKERQREWNLKNLGYKQKWQHNKSRTDPNFRFKRYLRTRIYQALKGTAKSKRTMKLIGCTIDELWTHLESKFREGMTRENHGKWHVDHIMPCASFNLTNVEQQKKCFHYTNLQPLWAFDNMSKGSKIISGDFTSPKT